MVKSVLRILGFFCILVKSARIALQTMVTHSYYKIDLRRVSTRGVGSRGRGNRAPLPLIICLRGPEYLLALSITQHVIKKCFEIQAEYLKLYL